MSRLQNDHVEASNHRRSIAREVWQSWVRQHLILQMIQHETDCNGMCVPEITNLTQLSRPAVSHHLQILKDAGIVKVRKEGTMNYYYFASDNAIEQLIETLTHANKIIHSLPDRNGE